MRPEALAAQVLEEISQPVESVEAKDGATWNHCGWLGIPLRASCPGCGKTYNQAHA